MGSRFLFLRGLKRSPLSRSLYSFSLIPTPPPLPLRFGLLLSYSFDPYRRSWASRSLSYGSVNLVLSDGKPTFETHEIEPPRKETYRTKKQPTRRTLGGSGPRERSRRASSRPPRQGLNIRLRSCSDVLCKVHRKRPLHGLLASMEQFSLTGCCGIHTSQPVGNIGQDVAEPQYNAGNVVSVDDNCKAKPKRKKLKGKRAVVRWLKFFRWKKKKEYERMTAEEKILYKLRKAHRKEDRLVQALKKLEPSETSETTHDPEVLTPEEHFYFLKMGHKCKNYVPVGRRGIFQGVILNMHLHWKKHQTLKVVVKTFTPEEVREIAAELARLSGGIVLDIHEGNTIIMYRGKNYAQPPTEIMSPRVALSKKKALDKSKYRDALRAVRRYIPKLQQDLEDIQAQMQREGENEGKPSTNKQIPDAEGNRTISDQQLERFEELKVQEAGSNELEDDESLESSTWSDSEDLSDIFETDSEGETEDKLEKPLYLDAVERFPSVNGGMPDDFEEHLRQIAAASKIGDSLEKDVKVEDLDEIDKIFLRASSLLKKRRR